MKSSRKSKNKKRKAFAGDAKVKKFKRSTVLATKLSTISTFLFLSIVFCNPVESGCPIPDVKIPDSWNEAWLERIKSSNDLREETWKDNVVACSVNVNSDGEVIAQKVTLSSGSDTIDQDALDLICSVAPFPCARGGVFGKALITIGPNPKVTIYPKFAKRPGSLPSRESYLEDWFKRTGEKIARGGSPDSDKPISLKFNLTSDTKIANLKVLKSSGSSSVDDQTVRLLVAANPLTSAPSKLPYKAGLIATFVKCPSSHVLFRISKEDESKIVNTKSLREVVFRIKQTALKMYDKERNGNVTAVDVAASMNKGVGGKAFGPLLACRKINREYQAEKSFVCSVVPTPYNDPKINSKVIQSTGNTLVDKTLLEIVTKTPFNWKMLQAFPWVRKGQNLYRRSLVVTFNKRPAVELEVHLGDEVFIKKAVSTNRINSVTKNKSVVKVKHGDPLYPQPKKDTPPTARSPKQFCKEYGDKWALVIGVNNFKHEVRKLKYCETDSKAFRDLLGVRPVLPVVAPAVVRLI